MLYFLEPQIIIGCVCEVNGWDKIPSFLLWQGGRCSRFKSTLARSFSPLPTMVLSVCFVFV